MGSGIGGHHSGGFTTETWLTPPHVLAALGTFDLDPCAAPSPRPWATALRHIELPQDGLAEPWIGRVWMNPPYGRETARWLARLADHGQGTALVFARTETAMFFSEVWGKADAILFLQGRLTFCRPDGKPGDANCGGPSALIAYGARDASILESCTLPGQFLRIPRAVGASVGLLL